MGSNLVAHPSAAVDPPTVLADVVTRTTAWPPARPGTDPPVPAPASHPRDPWLDNTKLVLVTLVVVGHTIGMLKDSAAGEWLYNFVYFWHIPAFVLVTGYFSDSFRWDRRHLVALVTTVALPYLIFEPALYAFRLALGEQLHDPLWLVPHWSMWYLPVLFLWRLATPVLRLHWVVLPVSVAVSLVGGLWSGQVFCAARALGLLPFFVLGLFLARRGLSWLNHRWVARAAVSALATVFVVARFTDEWARTAFLYYDAGYDDLGWSPLPAMWVRLVVMAIGLVGALSVIALVPRGRTWFTGMGAATMVVYLFHGFVVHVVEMGPWPAWATAHVVIGLPATVAAAVGLALLLASPPVRGRLVWAVDPVGSWRRHRREARPAGPSRTADVPREPASVAPRSATPVPQHPGRHR